MACGIYKITNILNKNSYVGSAIKIDVRIRHHFRELRRNCHCNPHLQNAFNKYGEDNFTWEILEVVENHADLISIEEIHIKKWDKEITLYNICKEVTNSQLGIKRSDETKRKIGAKSLGRRHTEETKEIIRRKNTSPSPETIRRRVEKRIGQKHSAETKEKIRISSTNRTHSEETKEKIRRARLGKKFSEETKEKLSLVRKGNTNALGMKHTDETRKKISEKNKGKKQSEETIAKRVESRRKYYENKRNAKL